MATHDASSPYSIAGILVRALPENLPAVIGRLSALSGVDVHHQDAGRLVVTLEATNSEEQRLGLELIRGQEGVVVAELMYHYVAPPEDDPVRPQEPPGDS